MAQAIDKVFTVTHIKSHIPLVLDMHKMNYDAWRELFETHCYSFGVFGHPDGTSTPANATDTTWKERDGIVKMWIYGTISPSLLDTILKARSSAREIWTSIENLFRDNKEARAIQLDNDLRSLTIGDLSVHDYCQKLKTLSDLLANVDSPVSDRVVVTHMLNGLSEKFDNIINIIKHRQPFPSFSAARSMLIEEERRLSKQVKTGSSPLVNSSSPNVLYVSSNEIKTPCPVTTTKTLATVTITKATTVVTTTTAGDVVADAVVTAGVVVAKTGSGILAIGRRNNRGCRLQPHIRTGHNKTGCKDHQWLT